MAREFTVNLPDGRQTGLDERAAHWSLARTLLDGVAPNPSRDETVRLWYRATLTFMHSQAQLYRPHVEHALQLFSSDAEMVFLAGCLHEFLAGPRIQAGIRSASLPSGTTFNVASPREEWQRAEALFRRALAIEPELTEGRLHLGRVLGLLGRHADAARELDRVVAAVQDPLLRYYARLFLGAEAERWAIAKRRARPTRTHRGCFRALKRPRLALSQLAAVRGDRSAAMTAIQPVLAPPADEEDLDDPWWTCPTLPRDAPPTRG